MWCKQILFLYVKMFKYRVCIVSGARIIIMTMKVNELKQVWTYSKFALCSSVMIYLFELLATHASTFVGVKGDGTEQGAPHLWTTCLRTMINELSHCPFWSLVLCVIKIYFYMYFSFYGTYFFLMSLHFIFILCQINSLSPWCRFHQLLDGLPWLFFLYNHSWCTEDESNWFCWSLSFSFSKDILGSQVMNHNDYDYVLTFPLVPLWCLKKKIEWIVITLRTDIHAPSRMNWNHFSHLWFCFYLTLSSSQISYLWNKIT